MGFRQRRAGSGATSGKVWAGIIGAVIIAAGGVIAALIERAPEPDASGEILIPQNGERVARSFTVEGTLSDIPDDRHVWVAVQIGNLLFPKEPEIPSADKHWSQDVVEGGNPAEGEFSVVLLTVDDNGHRVIEEWLGRGREGEGSPGLSTIPGSSKLDVVSGLVLE